MSFTITLENGNNLISFPYLPEGGNLDRTPSIVIGGLLGLEAGSGISGIIGEGIASSQPQPGSWVGSLGTIKFGDGYWVKNDSGQQLVMVFPDEWVGPPTSIIEINSGQNLKGWIGNDGEDISSGIPDDIEPYIKGVIGEGVAAQQSQPYSWVGSLANFYIGRGYWITTEPSYELEEAFGDGPYEMEFLCNNLTCPVMFNLPPTAVIEPEIQTVLLGDEVILDGTQSTDPDDDPLTYLFQCIAYDSNEEEINPTGPCTLPSIENNDGIIYYNTGTGGQYGGCMIPQACNYNPLADINDGSCIMPNYCFDGSTVCDDVCPQPDICDGVEVVTLFDVLDYPVANTSMISLTGEGWNLQGEIPPEIGCLIGLTHLEIGNQEGVGGIIPSSIGNLTNLNNLRLNSNNLTGGIPPEIGNLTNLGNLDLDNNNLTGKIPPSIGNLTNLITLFLSSNQLTGEIPSEIGNLTNLRNLNLKHNQLTKEIPSSIGNLTELTTIEIRGNQLIGLLPHEICNLNSLTSLQIQDNPLCPFPTSHPPEIVECLDDVNNVCNNNCGGNENQDCTYVEPSVESDEIPAGSYKFSLVVIDSFGVESEPVYASVSVETLRFNLSFNIDVMKSYELGSIRIYNVFNTYGDDEIPAAQFTLTISPGLDGTNFDYLLTHNTNSWDQVEGYELHDIPAGTYELQLWTGTGIHQQTITIDPNVESPGNIYCNSVGPLEGEPPLTVRWENCMFQNDNEHNEVNFSSYNIMFKPWEDVELIPGEFYPYPSYCTPEEVSCQSWYLPRGHDIGLEYNYFFFQMDHTQNGTTENLCMEFMGPTAYVAYLDINHNFDEVSTYMWNIGGNGAWVSNELLVNWGIVENLTCCDPYQSFNSSECDTFLANGYGSLGYLEYTYETPGIYQSALIGFDSNNNASNTKSWTINVLEKHGCMDETKCNYDPNATFDDGSYCAINLVNYGGDSTGIDCTGTCRPLLETPAYIDDCGMCAGSGTPYIPNCGNGVDYTSGISLSKYPSTPGCDKWGLPQVGDHIDECNVCQGSYSTYPEPGGYLWGEGPPIWYLDNDGDLLGCGTETIQSCQIPGGVWTSWHRGMTGTEISNEACICYNSWEDNCGVCGGNNSCIGCTDKWAENYCQDCTISCDGTNPSGGENNEFEPIICPQFGQLGGDVTAEFENCCCEFRPFDAQIILYGPEEISEYHCGSYNYIAILIVDGGYPPYIVDEWNWTVPELMTVLNQLDYGPDFDLELPELPDIIEGFVLISQSILTVRTADLPPELVLDSDTPYYPMGNVEVSIPIIFDSIPPEYGDPNMELDLGESLYTYLVDGDTYGCRDCTADNYNEYATVTCDGTNGGITCEEDGINCCCTYPEEEEQICSFPSIYIQGGNYPNFIGYTLPTVQDINETLMESFYISDPDIYYIEECQINGLSWTECDFNPILQSFEVGDYVQAIFEGNGIWNSTYDVGNPPPDLNGDGYPDWGICDMENGVCVQGLPPLGNECDSDDDCDWACPPFCPDGFFSPMGWNDFYPGMGMRLYVNNSGYIKWKNFSLE